MADWIDYYSGQRVDSLARLATLRHHDARVVGSIPGLGSFNTVRYVYNYRYYFNHGSVLPCYIYKGPTGAGAEFNSLKKCYSQHSCTIRVKSTHFFCKDISIEHDGEQFGTA